MIKVKSPLDGIILRTVFQKTIQKIEGGVPRRIFRQMGSGMPDRHFKTIITLIV